MARYHQYCPISRASEILAERWTPLIIRNLMFGAVTFTAIAGGVPAMSRSMLIKRLRELERSGVISATPKEHGQGSIYRLTPAGEDLADVIHSLGVWGERWVEVTTDRADPGFALWTWCQVQLDRSALPEERTVVAFTFPDQPAGNRYYWLLVEKGDAEVCYSDPGDRPAAEIVAGSLPFVNWHRGVLAWSDAIRSGEIRVTGARSVTRAIPTWHLAEPLVHRG